MTVAEASGITGIQLEQVGPLPEADTFCTYFNAKILGQLVRARVIQNRIDRIEISSPAFPTLSGIAVGDSIERVKSAYGKSVSVEPHKYLWERGVVLIVLGPFVSRGQKYGVSFTASPDKGVTEIWVGWFEGIRESEGCA